MHAPNTVRKPSGHVLDQAVQMYQVDPSLSDPAAYTAVCFGKKFGGKNDTNWSFTKLATSAELLKDIGQICSELNISTIWGPSPTKFNAAIVKREALRKGACFQVSNSALMWRNQREPADACEVGPGEAVAFSAGGCPLIKLRYRSRMFVAHAGFKCLVDFERIRTPHNKSHEHESVTHTLLHELGILADMNDVYVEVFFSIPAVFFPYPLQGEFAKFNEKLRDYIVGKGWSEGLTTNPEETVLYPDLPKLIAAQFRTRGVPEKNIDISHAYLPKEGVWLDGTPGEGRNLVLIARHT